MRTVLATLISAAVLAIPAQADAASDRFVACENDEPTPGCVWVANRMGNGEGRSYVVYRTGTKRFITHARAEFIIRRF